MLTLIFAAIIAWIIFNFLVKVVKTTAVIAILIAAVVVIIQVTNGVTPQVVWDFITKFPQSLSR